MIAQMDVDGSHDPKDLVRLIEKANDYDCVIGSRWIMGGHVVGWPLRRRLVSRVGNVYVEKMLALAVRDATAGFRVYNADWLRKINLQSITSSGYGFQIEMTLRLRRAGATFFEVPITFRERVLGSSKMTLAIIWEALYLVTKWALKARWSRKHPKKISNRSSV